MSFTEVAVPEQLVRALDAQSRMPITRIGEALVALGMITGDQLAAGSRWCRWARPWCAWVP